MLLKSDRPQTKISQTIERAQDCYENRPCDYRYSENQTMREFARNLAENNGMKPVKSLVDAIIAVIRENE